MEKLYPYFVEKPWGGSFLSKIYSMQPKKIGEAWLISTLDQSETQIQGQDLSKYLGKKLPYLIKIIDADDNLSIQVHPNDEWAKKLENSKGKTECWYILNAKPGAGIYLGVKPHVTENEFREAILAQKPVNDLMNFFAVKPGDFISVPAGTIHAIGGGVTLLEVQQASGITYRLWDWGRTDRELHIDKGLMVSKFEAQSEIQKAKQGLLLAHNDFKCYLNEHQGPGWFIDLDTLDFYLSETHQSKNYFFIPAE